MRRIRDSYRYALLALLLAPACLHGVVPEPGDRCAADTGSLSRFTQAFLVRAGEQDRLDRDPGGLLQDLLRDLASEGNRTQALHLAEIACFAGLRAEAGSEAAVRFHLAAADLAHAWLFDSSLGALPRGENPVHGWALSLYNRSLADVVAALAARRPLRARSVTLPSVTGRIRLRAGTSDLPWDPATYDEFLPASAVVTRSPVRRVQTPGIGVPCVAVRKPASASPRRPDDQFLPPFRQSFAATVLVRFGSPFADGDEREATVDVLDPLAAATVEIAGRSLPLAADLTTPLLHMLENTAPPSGLHAMLRPKDWDERSGLYMLQPYRRGRVPVVFVHGLMSTPRTWLALLNELLADPVLRGHCQFWFFFYPTGNPMAYSAAVLREALRTVRETCAPSGDDPALDRMVVCGHSMGGLLTRLLIEDPGDRLWRAVADVPIEGVHLTAPQRMLVERTLFFEPLPFVRRVVFLATPHRGAELAAGVGGRIGGAGSGLAARLIDAAQALRPTMDQAELERRLWGVSNLSPGSPLLLEVASWDLPSSVPAHSIVGDRTAADRPGGTDGIVDYASAHLEGVASERIVRSGHSVQESPAAIDEVRRILRLHLQAPAPAR